MMYWGNRAKSRDTFQGTWTPSGDMYARNPDGSYTYSGRSDDMLKVSGIYVSAFEVEATQVEHPAVLEAAVIGTQDAEGLTKTKAGLRRNIATGKIQRFKLRELEKDRRTTPRAMFSGCAAGTGHFRSQQANWARRF